ncbi:MAG: hypothetical protein IT287_04975 [Bdellovibrionaceae bacterium]|nr:hypothetical protein [Pseudobdellovibrionaceae bacterium]
MVELKFVLKCLAITVVLMAALQFEVQGVRAEHMVANYLRDGKIVVWVRESMKGAHHFVVHKGKEVMPGLMSGHWMPKWEEKAKEPKRNISSDLPPTEFPDDEIGDEAVQKAGVF